MSKNSSTKVDPSKVSRPKVEFTAKALTQLALILKNDFTLAGKYLRLLISGKGCDGFTYSIGFTDFETDDLMVPLNNPTKVINHHFNRDEFFIAIDPFTAFYLQNAQVDYVEDFVNDNEGFKVVNLDQGQYKGKFWRKDEQKIPQTLHQSL